MTQGPFESLSKVIGEVIGLLSYHGQECTQNRATWAKGWAGVPAASPPLHQAQARHTVKFGK